VTKGDFKGALESPKSMLAETVSAALRTVPTDLVRTSNDLNICSELSGKMEMQMPDHKSQGIERTGRGEEQPADKDRAQTANKTEPTHMPDQPVIREKENERLH
jgi:hypothetical protein